MREVGVGVCTEERADGLGGFGPASCLIAAVGVYWSVQRVFF
jgi:hypothetical protein